MSFIAILLETIMFWVIIGFITLSENFPPVSGTWKFRFPVKNRKSDISWKKPEISGFFDINQKPSIKLVCVSNLKSIPFLHQKLWRNPFLASLAQFPHVRNRWFRRMTYISRCGRDNFIKFGTLVPNKILGILLKPQGHSSITESATTPPVEIGLKNLFNSNKT